MVSLSAVTTDPVISEVAGLARRIWNEHFPSIIGQAQVDYMLEKFQSSDAIRDQIHDGYLYFLIRHDADAIGYIGLLPDPQKAVLLLSKFYISHEYRGRGIGRASLQQVFVLARSLRLDHLQLTVNRHNNVAIRAYEKMGLTRSGETVQDIGNGFVMDDLIMEMPVPADSGIPGTS